MKSKNYYVYEHYNIDNNEIFYVGKGSGRRYNDIYKRNKEWKEYVKTNNYNVRIIKYFGNNEKEAYKYEKQRIMELKSKGQCCCNIDDGGWKGGSTRGNRNSQYGISPKQRMSKQVYDNWIKYLKDCQGEKNNNYGNKTLSQKYKNDKELFLQKQSRPAGQNGKAKKMNLYDVDMNLIKCFYYIGGCVKYLDNLGIIISREKIRKYSLLQKPYKDYYFKNIIITKIIN